MALLFDLRTYSRLRASLVNSKLAKENNALYQTILGLIAGAETNARFNNELLKDMKNGTFFSMVIDEAAENGIDGTDGLKGLNGSDGTNGLNGASPDEMLELLKYAFIRIKFLENALNIEYKKNDIVVPEEISLLGDDIWT